MLADSTDAATFDVAKTVPQPLIMVVENDLGTRNMLRTALKTQGYDVVEASSAEIALAMLSENPKFIIVDLDLPDIQSDDLLRLLRGRNDMIPIVAFSNRADESCIVQALDLGADAYLTKPFGMKELFARVRNMLRHRRTVAQGGEPVLRSGNLSVDLSRRLVDVGEKRVKLTRKEFELLRILLQNAGKVLTHRFLLDALWSQPADVNQLRGFIRQVRKKIEADPQHPRLLLTEPWIGYRMLAPLFSKKPPARLLPPPDGALIAGISSLPGSRPAFGIRSPGILAIAVTDPTPPGV
jgi:two-component system KDP operon response regulator KdpE